MHIFTSKKRPFIRISVLQSHMRSTYPRQVDSSQNRVAKDVLPTAPSPRRMTSQSMCKNGCWLDNHCLLLTQELKRLLQNWPYFSPKRWQQLFSRFLMVLQWSSKLLWVQVHHHPSCVEAQETPKVYWYVSLKLHILGLFIIIIFPKPQGLSCRPLHNMGCWRGDDPTKASQVLKYLECKGENNFHLVIIWQSCHLPKTR